MCFPFAQYRAMLLLHGLVSAPEHFCSLDRKNNSYLQIIYFFLIVTFLFQRVLFMWVVKKQILFYRVSGIQ